MSQTCREVNCPEDFKTLGLHCENLVRLRYKPNVVPDSIVIPCLFCYARDGKVKFTGVDRIAYAQLQSLEFQIMGIDDDGTWHPFTVPEESEKSEDKGV